MSATDRDPLSLFSSMPFARTLGIEAGAMGPDEVRARVGWSEERCTTAGVLHGGALMALADTAGAMCALLNLPDDATGTTTVESKTNFFRAIRSGHVEAVSRPLHAGRTLVVVETVLHDDEGHLAAKVTQTQLVLRAEPEERAEPPRWRLALARRVKPHRDDARRGRATRSTRARRGG
jgi:1,4-dihydroxy-2-naphthoyl-CoA hydrolase